MPSTYLTLRRFIEILTNNFETIFQSIRSPGAYHRARWLAIMIYSLKIYLFREEFHLTAKELDNLRQFNIFMLKVNYPKFWYTCPQATLAPQNDLELLKNIIDCGKINVKLSEVAYQSFKKHLWYLSEPLCALAFFDPRISNLEKKRMVQNLTVVSPPDYERRIDIDKSQVSQKNISDFVTCNTLKFLQDYGISTEWLKLEPNQWAKDINYIKAKKLFQSLQVVNDCVERKIKLIQDYNLSLTKDEIIKQGLLHGVDGHRKRYPNCNKSYLLNKKSKKFCLYEISWVRSNYRH